MFRCKGAIDLVVRTHHCPGLGLLDSFFERGQVDLTESAFIYFGAYAEALEFLAIRSVMLERCTHSFGLNTIDETGSHFACEVRVFREIFKVAPTQRRTFHVGARPEQHIHLHCDTLFGEGNAHLLDQVYVPGRGEAGGCRETGGWQALFSH